MTEKIIIVLLLLALIYLYYRQNNSLTKHSNSITEFGSEIERVKGELDHFLQTNLGSGDLEELKGKLGEKTLDEILEENQDYETEVDTLTRTKNSLEQDLLAQSNAFQNRLREKDREVKKLKEDLTAEKKRADKTQQSLTSEKQQHKGSLERISKLSEQVVSLEKQQQEQLRAINLLFDEKAQDYAQIDFNGLYELLKQKVK